VRALIRICVVVAAALCVPNAQAAGWRLLDTGRAPAVTDGERYVAYQPDLETTRVIDTRGRNSFSVPTPPGCARSPNHAYQDIAAVGGNRLLWWCGKLMNLGTRSIADVAGLSGTSPGDDCELDGVGHRWVSEHCFGYHYSYRVYIHSATGKRKVETLSRGPGRRYVADLDSRQLWRKPCAPLRRTAREPDIGVEEPFYPFAYARPFGFTTIDGGLTVQRCGRSKGRRIWSGSVAYLQVGGDVATWLGSNGRVVAYTPSTGRRRVLRAPAANSWVAHTSNCLFVADVVVPPKGDSHARIRVAAVPGRACDSGGSS